MSTKVNPAGVSHARSLVAAGKINDGAWSFSAEDGNALLGAAGDDWENFGRWHLAVHADQPDNTKAHYGYPYGKGGEVYRAALSAAMGRATQQGADDVAEVCQSMMKMMEPGENHMKKAYSLLEIKSMQDDERIITGIATTPTPDRAGDIVNPKGAVFELPIPLLWQHEPGQPVGEVFAAEITSRGIEIKARFAKITEPGKLKDRLDECWQTVKHKLVRGLSIGFKEIEAVLIPGPGPKAYNYKRWMWLELSAVTIPANTQATILSIKQAVAARDSSPSIVVVSTLPVVRAKRHPGAVYLR